jgi:hypothetical protein
MVDEKKVRTTVQIFLYARLLDTRVPTRYSLVGELGTFVAVAVRVHGDLQRLALPAEDVIAVVPQARRVPVAPDERLGAVLGPLGGDVVEGRGVPDDLVEELRDRDRVRRGTGRAGLECPI